MRNYYKTRQTAQNMITQIELSKIPSNEINSSDNRQITNNLSELSNTDSWILSGDRTNIKKSIIGCISFGIIAYGVILLALITEHYDYAPSFCNKLSSESTAFMQSINSTICFSKVIK